ncbi:MAG TPA: hypothetical protein VH418_01110 [Solirubrobacteraceae bacterium]|jgi:polyhydroxyalkanoate synthesis regulator phasin
MAKNKKKKEDESPPDLGDAIRSALERTFHAYTESGERTRAVLDEMASAAARIRQSLQEAGVADEIAGLRREVQALAQRVAALEAEKAKPAPARRASTTRKTAGTKPASTAKRSTGTRTRRTPPASSS